MWIYILWVTSLLRASRHSLSSLVFCATKLCWVRKTLLVSGTSRSSRSCLSLLLSKDLILVLVIGWSYCPEPFQPIASYCPEPFRPITSYFPEPFRPITSCNRTCYWPETEKEKLKFQKYSPTPSKPPLVRPTKVPEFCPEVEGNPVPWGEPVHSCL